jgi:hypothetical protein
VGLPIVVAVVAVSQVLFRLVVVAAAAEPKIPRLLRFQLGSMIAAIAC